MSDSELTSLDTPYRRSERGKRETDSFLIEALFNRRYFPMSGSSREKIPLLHIDRIKDTASFIFLISFPNRICFYNRIVR